MIATMTKTKHKHIKTQAPPGLVATAPPVIQEAPVAPVVEFSELDRVRLQLAVEKNARIRSQLDATEAQHRALSAEIQGAQVALAGLRVELEERYAIGPSDEVSVAQGRITRKKG
jgi:hypothetical protein